MSIIRVTREFSFEMAHVLKGYDGPCRNVHGHSYRLFVTITGKPVNDNNSPRNGMVLDFTDLKGIVHHTIIDSFDHSVVISSDFADEKKKIMDEAFGNAVIVDYQPTCENLVTDFAERIKSELPAGVKLHSLRLCETANSYAEWFATDNE